MIKKFKEKESYKHLFAKELLAKWFQEEEINNDFCNVAQFSWRANYGVFTELKFHKTDDPCYFENSKGLNTDKDGFLIGGFNEEFDRGPILFIPDVIIFHKGSPRYIFEVVNTNPVSNFKLQKIKSFFDGYYIELYEIYVDDILKFDKNEKPNYLECNRLI